MINWKRKVFLAFNLSLLSLSIISCKEKRSEDDVRILGLDNEGKSVVRYLPKKKYIKKFNGMLGDLHGETTKRLEHFQFDGDWDLKRVSVGLQIVGEAKLTPKFKLEVEPFIELRFHPLPQH